MKILVFLIGLWLGFMDALIICNKKNKDVEKNGDCIELKNIKIFEDFQKTKPKKDKWEAREKYYKKNGKLYTPVVINQDNYLVDGYISYLIAKKYKISEIEVYRRIEE